MGRKERPCGKFVSGNDVSGGDADAEDAEEDAAVRAVQALIDALPDEVTAENADELQAQLIAIDKAMDALDEAQTAKLNMTRYENICAALATFVAVQDGTTHEKNHPVCGDVDCEKHGNVLTGWTPLSYDPDTKILKIGEENWGTIEPADDPWDYELPEGNYYLATDLLLATRTNSEGWEPSRLNQPRIKNTGNVTICLNGHTIEREDAAVSATLLYASEGYTFSLCDCSGCERNF